MSHKILPKKPISLLLEAKDREPKWFSWLVDTLSLCEYDTAWANFAVRLGAMDTGVFLQITFDAPDIISGAMKPQFGRKWYISPFMAKNEVIQTLFLAITTAEEHERRENFKYSGIAVFGPHYDLDKLAARGLVAPELLSQERMDPMATAKEGEAIAPPHAGKIEWADHIYYCGNCGYPRTIDNYCVAEQCPNPQCGDDETDLTKEVGP